MAISTLMLLVANVTNIRWCKKNTGKWLNPCTWVFIWEYSVKAIWWIPTWQGLDDFQNLCVLVLRMEVALEGLSLYRTTDTNNADFTAIYFPITPLSPMDIWTRSNCWIQNRLFRWKLGRKSYAWVWAGHLLRYLISFGNIALAV